MASWTPQPDGLVQLLQLLADSLSDNTEVQLAVTKRLDTFNSIPDYNNYLTHVLVRMPEQEERVRSVAGLILKNNVKYFWRQLPPDVTEYVKTVLVDGISDPMPMVRQTTGTVVVTVLQECGPANWPQALSKLVQALDSPNELEQEGAFGTLSKVCEDMPRSLDAEIAGIRPLDFMIPKFITMLTHPSARIRTHALKSLNSFIPLHTPSFAASIDAFIAALFQRASDEIPEVRQHVCAALVQLLAARPDKLMPEMDNVATFMLYSTQDKDEAVALEACEFWLTFAEEHELAQHLRPLLPRVAPVLLQGMVYSETDLILLDTDEDDAAVPDRESDIKPKFYGGKAHTQASEGAAGAGMAKMGRDAGAEDEDEEDEDEDYDDDDFDDDELTSEWNLRKCSAAAIDVMAVNYGDDLLAILLPLLKERLFAPDWLNRESGILALGAIAEGCIEGIEPHLPTLVPFLIQSLNDPKPLVRSITCWTLGRYSSWCVQPLSDEHRNTYFIPAMEGLLRMVLDNNKRVQEAGCSAFATLEEEAGRELAPFLHPVLGNLVFAFSKYQQKNLLILYDAIGTLADAVGDALDNKEFVDVLMQPLVEKWQKLKDEDEDLIPLFECLSSVTVAAGHSFAPYAQPVFERCVRIIRANLAAFQATLLPENANVDQPDKTFVIVALDLLSGLVQGLGQNAEQLIASSDPPLLQLLSYCLKYPEPSVRQSAYALLGDLAVSCFGILRPALGQLLPDMTHQIEVDPRMDSVSVCNNAAWAAGEVAMSYTRVPDVSEFKPFVPGLIERLVPILLNPKSVKSLSENAAVTIGRIGLVCPEIVAPHLEHFATAWCQSLWEIKDNEEKDSAFRGFCTMVQANPSGLAKSLPFFCNAVVRWSTPSAELNAQFNTLLNSFKAAAGDNWPTQMAALPAPIQERLRDRYNL